MTHEPHRTARPPRRLGWRILWIGVAAFSVCCPTTLGGLFVRDRRMTADARATVAALVRDGRHDPSRLSPLFYRLQPSDCFTPSDCLPSEPQLEEAAACTGMRTNTSYQVTYLDHPSSPFDDWRYASILYRTPTGRVPAEVFMFRRDGHYRITSYQEPRCRLASH